VTEGSCYGVLSNPSLSNNDTIIPASCKSSLTCTDTLCLDGSLQTVKPPISVLSRTGLRSHLATLSLTYAFCGPKIQSYSHISQPVPLTPTN
jgi:hypothetical protein